jgi:hypothetical protein
MMFVPMAIGGRASEWSGGCGWLVVGSIIESPWSRGLRTAGGRSGLDDQRRRVALLSVVLCQPMDRGWAVNEWAEEALRVFRTSWSRC